MLDAGYYWGLEGKADGHLPCLKFPLPLGPESKGQSVLASAAVRTPACEEVYAEHCGTHHVGRTGLPVRLVWDRGDTCSDWGRAHARAYRGHDSQWIAIHQSGAGSVAPR